VAPIWAAQTTVANVSVNANPNAFHVVNVPSSEMTARNEQGAH